MTILLFIIINRKNQYFYRLYIKANNTYLIFGLIYFPFVFNITKKNNLKYSILEEI